MTRTTAKPWSSQAAGPAAKESLSWWVGPPWTSNTVGNGPSPAPAGRWTSACTRPPGPSTQTSSTGTEPGGTAPGARSTTVPAVERTADGSAAEDHRNSTVPSGRGVAPPTVPRGVSSRVSTPSSRE